MGCVESEIMTHQTLKNQLSKVKYTCDVKKQRTSDELKKLEKQLSLQFIKPLTLRNKSLERVMISGNARTYNERLVYLQLENECKIIIERSNLISPSDIQKVKKSIDILLYCSTYLPFENLSLFEHMFKHRFPQYKYPEDQDIENDIMKDLKKKQVSFQSQLQYIFEYSITYNISMETINAVGHSYKYGATEYQ